MVTETRTDSALEQYIGRRQSEERLLPDASDDARQFQRMRYAFDYEVARSRGWRPDELAAGRLASGASVSAGGNVFRQEPTISNSLQDEAGRALQALSNAGTHIEGVLQINLESASYGTWSGNEGPIRAAIAAAHAAVAAVRQQAQARQETDAAKVRVTIHQTFRGIGNVVYQAGTRDVTPEERDDLLLWKNRMESSARQHQWDAPVGFSPDSWPPFTFEPK